MPDQAMMPSNAAMMVEVWALRERKAHYFGDMLDRNMSRVRRLSVERMGDSDKVELTTSELPRGQRTADTSCAIETDRGGTIFAFVARQSYVLSLCNSPESGKS